MQNYPLTPLDSVQRRCAAFMTLSEFLEGESLMKALWMLEERDQSADKITFIGFFGVTAELLGINSNVITTLYAKLNRNLDLPLNELPDDPMPEMLNFRGIKSNTNISPFNKTPAKTNVVSLKTNQKPKVKTKGSAEMTVCVSMMNNIMKEAGYPESDSFSLFTEIYQEEINRSQLEIDIKEQVISWVTEFNIKAFKRNYEENQLPIIIHCIYIALCEALGPVIADKIIHLAMNKTSQLAVAQQYSPKKLL